MQIAGKEYSEILVTDSEDNVIVSITDENIIEGNGYSVLLYRAEKDAKLVSIKNQETSTSSQNKSYKG